MNTTFAAAAVAAALVLSPMAVRAQAAPPAPAAPACSPTVSAALETWDLGMAAAERFGEKAAALAREKGREYLLPLLGIDPKAPPPSSDPKAGPGMERTADDVARAVEASRNDPARRAELCIAITRAMNEARDTARSTAGAGLEALRRAVEGLGVTPATPPAPAPGGPLQGNPTPDGLIKT